ncbi:MAG: hypothetical protein WAW09_01385, partial [Smithella sp.]
KKLDCRVKPGNDRFLLIPFQIKDNFFYTFLISKITRRRGVGSAGVYDNTLRKPTTMLTKIAL